jgi:tRNA-modifying protein YgfZ
MNPSWQAALEQTGARIGADGSVGFGDPAEELILAQSCTVVVPLTHVGLIRAGGPDVPEFLHNLLTNSARHLRPDQAQLNSLCSAKGRMLASFLVWREGADYLLQLSRDIHGQILKKLGMYVLRSRVKLSDASGDYALIGINGAEARATVQALGVDPQAAMTTAALADGVVIRLAESRYQIALKAEAAAGLWQRLSSTALGAGTHVWRWLEIAAGVPQITGRTQEEFVPQMANFELIGGVSFQKGCYPGQEIIARTQYLGKLKRRMYLAHLGAETVPEPGAQLYAADLPEQSCGTVVNAAPAPGGGHDLLAVIQMTSATGDNVRLGSVDGPRLQFRPLPYALG